MLELNLWAGTESSFDNYLNFLRYKADHNVVVEGMKAFYYDDDDEEADSGHRIGRRLLKVDDGTATVTISGTLVPEFTYYNAWFGLVSYEEIADALNLAVDNEDAKKILLVIDSGGGAVTGLDEVAQLIKHIDRNIKPVYAHTGSIMASGAYWLASSARKIYGAKTAHVGSIGVLMVHQSYHRLLKERGIDAKVFRAGKYKALGHPVEKLSEVAIKEIQSKIDKTYNYFLQHVSSNRPVEIVNKDKWAEGRVFYSEDALKINLIDGIKYLTETVEILKSSNDNLYLRVSEDTESNSQGSDDMADNNQKVVGSEQDLAAIQSGASADDLVIEEVNTEENTSGDENTSSEENNSGDDNTSKASTDPVDPENNEEEENAEAAPTKVIAGVDPAIYAEAVGKAAVLERENSELKAKLETSAADTKALLDIAVTATNRLQTALNQSPTPLEGISASVVLETYTKVQAQFNETFKVGAASKTVKTGTDQAQAEEASGIYPV